MSAVRSAGTRRYGNTATRSTRSMLPHSRSPRRSAAEAVRNLDPQTRRTPNSPSSACAQFAEAQLGPSCRSRSSPAGPAPRPSRDPDRARRLLCAGRALSPAVGADHDHRAGQGRGLRRGHRLPAAQRAPGDDRRLPSRRAPTASSAIGGAQAIAAMAYRHRDASRRSTRSSAPAMPSSTRRSARSSARSASTSSPVRAKSSSSRTRRAMPR